MFQKDDKPCEVCGKMISDNEYVVGWGECGDCWDDNIDTHHILNLFREEKVYPPGTPSPKVERIIRIIERRLKRDEKNKNNCA